MSREFLTISTIPQLIAYEKTLDISHNGMHFKSNFTSNNNNVIINFSSVCDKYFDYVSKYSPLVTLSDREFIDYRFQPKKLSLHLYDTVELWSLMLKLNNMDSVLQFNKQTLYLPLRQIFEVLNEIIILEKNEISVNKKNTGL